jgi:hypothetical protein
VRTCTNCGHSIRDDDRFCASCGAPADAPWPLGSKDDGGARRPLPGQGNLAAYIRPLRRFWWLVGAGVAVAAYVALSSAYSVQLFPPKLTSKATVTYTSSSRLLVTSQQQSHLRYQFSIYGEVPLRNEEGELTGETETTLVNTSAPDLNTLVRAANLFPLLIESDQVAEHREREFGPLDGVVNAQGIYSFATGTRFELSEIPVIQLVSIASTPEAAVELADKTAKAFVGWMREEQAADEIPPQDRIVVQQLAEPKGATASSDTSRTMPMLIFLVLVSAFVVLAILLDRLILSRPRPAPADVEPIERPVEVKKTA